ncbi:MAG TPA: DUF3037 domain-containing protein [Edaphocola sp.]|nr:DUF3037 domain-containing protein [Edaphocola sp.]
MHLYEYAIIRFVPKVEREEFINVGLLLYCKASRFLAFRYHINTEKFKSFPSEISLEELELHLVAFEKIAKGFPGSAIGALEISERFRWLSAVKSSVLQSSRPHPGRTLDLDKTFESLFQSLIL